MPFYKKPAEKKLKAGCILLNTIHINKSMNIHVKYVLMHDYFYILSWLNHLY